jgi:hypothetical protein
MVETLGATLVSYAAKLEGQKEVVNYGVRLELLCTGNNILPNHGIV